MIVALILTLNLAPAARAETFCARYLARAGDNFRRVFNARVIAEHQRRSVKSFAIGYNATRLDWSWSARIHSAVERLDRVMPGWDVDPRVLFIATDVAIPLIARGVVPRVYPAHSVVVVRDGVPVIAIDFGAEDRAPRITAAR